MRREACTESGAGKTRVQGQAEGEIQAARRGWSEVQTQEGVGFREKMASRVTC